MSRALLARHPGLGSMDEAKRKALLTAARLDAMQARRSGAIWQIVVPPLVGLGATALFIAAWPELLGSWGGRMLAVVPAAVLPPWLYLWMRRRWLAPFIAARLGEAGRGAAD